MTFESFTLNNSTMTENITEEDHYFDLYSDYHYNYEDSHTLPLEELIPVTVAYGLTLVIGITGNILVIASVIRFRKLHSVTNVFLLSLASADLLLVTICVPVKCIAFFTYSWRLGEFLCKFVNYLQNLSIICSVMTLTGLSLERYYAILHPIKSKYVCTISLARRSVLCIWILSIIMATPTLAGQTHKTVGTYRNAHWCILEWNNSLVQRLYGTYMFMIILLVPFLIVSYAYTSICRKLWKMDKRDRNLGDKQEVVQLRRVLSRRDKKIINQRGTNGDDNNTRKQVVKMLVTIILLFMISWGPITTNNLLVSFDILDNLHMGTLKHVRQAFYVLSYFNSCVNPIVYGFMSKNFRKAFIIALGFMCFGRRPRNRFWDETVVRFSTDNRSSSIVQGYPYRVSKQFTREQNTLVH
ncbi:QRFP-like peptide receptor [Saccostrea echinata]|uniref:QRFP-like peptide receptor n=1 Tax=Saccostrea echinata TaxID=191078 RepID=UPI002A821AF2|nr:QRFP-like peptide receptor [Saccostrea echinata]